MKKMWEGRREGTGKQRRNLWIKRDLNIQEKRGHVSTVDIRQRLEDITDFCFSGGGIVVILKRKYIWKIHTKYLWI